MKANGKADLYFHAYFWEKYLRSLNGKGGKPSIMKGRKGMEDGGDMATGDPTGVDYKLDSLGGGSQSLDIFSDDYPFMKRVLGLSATLSKVIVNIKKFPFHEKMYHKYATEFGQRNTQKKMKYLEEI